MARENDVRDQVLHTLLDKVREDPFPSPTMLDMIEGMLQDDENDVAAYTGLLMEKVRGDAFPSLDHLRRLQAFA